MLKTGALYVGPLKNSLDLVLRPDDEIKAELADVTPTIVTDETVTKVRIDNVVDTVVQRPYNVVYGDREFVVSGMNLVTTDEGAADKVLIKLYKEGVCADEGDLTTAGKVVSSSDTAINLSGFDWNNRTVPDGDWWDAYPDSKLIVVKSGVRYEHPITFKGE